MTVVAGPSEATAAGNALVQALAKGIVSSVADARALVARSFELQHYEPQSKESWDAAYEKARRFFG
ncbi:MAG TPA: rhamnulokinase, partial [Acidobacteriota bacterium]|nr:rhamnulokinase [Acidobacteriota bacterium]